MGAVELDALLTDLAVRGRVSASTQNQALNALVFLHREVRHRDLEEMAGVVRAKRPVRIPVVLSQAEVRRLLDVLEGAYGLMARLLYGTGMRLMECVRLRVKDLDQERNPMIERDGKGAKHRVPILPLTLRGTSPRVGLRHPSPSGVARAQGCLDDASLHACDGQPCACHIRSIRTPKAKRRTSQIPVILQSVVRTALLRRSHPGGSVVRRFHDRSWRRLLWFDFLIRESALQIALATRSPAT